MTRSRERLLRRLLYAFSLLSIAGSGWLAFAVLGAPIEPAELPEITVKVVGAPKKPALDPRINELASLRMSRVVPLPAPAPAPLAPPPPPPPELASLIRVKGILDYGDAASNEAVIEVVRTGRSTSYKAGETIPDVNAKIEKIDTSVIFLYNGKTIWLDMKSNERADTSNLTNNPDLGTLSLRP